MLALHILEHLALEIGLSRTPMVDCLGVGQLNEVVPGLMWMLYWASEMVVRELLAVTHPTQLAIKQILSAATNLLHVSRGVWATISVVGSVACYFHVLLLVLLVREEVKTGLLIFVDVIKRGIRTTKTLSNTLILENRHRLRPSHIIWAAALLSFLFIMTMLKWKLFYFRIFLAIIHTSRQILKAICCALQMLFVIHNVFRRLSQVLGLGTGCPQLLSGARI